MNKDLLTTVIGLVSAAIIAAKEYLAVQTGTEEFGSLTFWIGMGSAMLVAVFGKWAKRGE